VKKKTANKRTLEPQDLARKSQAFYFRLIFFPGMSDVTRLLEHGS